ncbi:hypothetical protein B296_00019395 [Ensete ventricosum]|uniref:Xyloglucan endotransglucosylase/hydrolase n=1 Tax=Ensete ventricosum TaxID=4639 RepID=A0A426ZFA8_ENSVE|nr:hypothetical protein B296_00019395 [Ensete ventricosum]
MAFHIPLLVFLVLRTADAQPSPGYHPSSSLSPITFYEGYRNLWGPQHQTISPDQYSTTIWLDTSSGLLDHRQGDAVPPLVRSHRQLPPFAILWDPDEIIFLVDDVPIRRYARKVEATFPDRPMWVYGSIWDASSWATDNGKYKADYRYQPFVAKYTDFKLGGCTGSAPPSCRPVPSSPSGLGLSPQQYAAMRWVQNNYMVYYYCEDSGRDHSLTPEC